MYDIEKGKKRMNFRFDRINSENLTSKLNPNKSDYSRPDISSKLRYDTEDNKNTYNPEVISGPVSLIKYETKSVYSRLQ